MVKYVEHNIPTIYVWPEQLPVSRQFLSGPREVLQLLNALFNSRC
jgi:hypothetical protein